MPSREVWWFGPFVFDPAKAELSKDKNVVRLAPRVAAVLDLLIDRGGTIVTPTELRDAIWPDTDVDVADDVILCVAELRTAVDDDENKPTFIETIPNRGYRFIAPVSRGRHSGTAEVPQVRPRATSAGALGSRRWAAIAGVAVLILIALVALFRGWFSSR